MNEENQILDKSEAMFKDRGSKFFAYAFPLKSADEVEACVEDVRPKHKNANHFCYAYQIGKGDSAQIRVNDDGEPSGSAGLPILNQIKSAGLTDVLVVVAREFGGSKLGISGLINAYRTSTKEALENAPKGKKVEYKIIELNLGFDLHGEIISLISKNQLEIIQQKFTDRITFLIRVEAKKSRGTMALFQAYQEKLAIKVLD